MILPNRSVLFASFVRTVMLSAAAVLFLTTLLPRPLGGQDQPPAPIEDVFTVATQDALTKTIADREHRAWAAFKKQDAAAFAALTTDDYRAVLANGAMHFYRPTAQEMAAVNVTQYIVSQFQAVPIGREGALITYVGLFAFGGSGPLKFAFGEVWVKQGDEWKCQYSQATVTP